MAELIKEAIEKYGLEQKNRKKTLFSRIGVVGCGKEGSYIVTVAASKGIDVVFLEPSQEAIENALSRVESRLDKRIENWGLTQSEKKAILARINPTTEYKDFAGCDFVIEAIRYDDMGVRNVESRKEVFRKLEEVLDENAIIASNVATIFVTELANDLKHKERSIGMHFISNVPDSHILEIIPSVFTSDEIYKNVCQFAKIINNDYISILESSGLVSLRLFFVQLNEACSIVMEGVSEPADIDKVLTIGFGHAQGVFRTADQMGIEKIVHLMENMFQEYGDKKYKLSPLLNRLYRAKEYGISRGKGFYRYNENGNVVK